MTLLRASGAALAYCLASYVVAKLAGLGGDAWWPWFVIGLPGGAIFWLVILL